LPARKNRGKERGFVHIYTTPLFADTVANMMLCRSSEVMKTERYGL
jgi:hypothetical protein